VSQKRLAEDMKTSRQNITNQLAKLRAAGYVEVVRKGFRGDHTNTLRVVFDPSISAEDAIAMTSNKEDTRPPSMQEDIDPEGQKRIAQLISKALKQPTKPKGYEMPKQGDTRAVREVKEAMAKAKAKRSKTVDNHVEDKATIGNRTVSNEASSEVSNDSLHRQPIGHSGVSYNTREHSIDKDIKVKDKEKIKDKPNVLRNLEVSDFDLLIDAGMKPEQVEDCAKTLLPLFAAEGLNPTSRVLADSILQLYRDAR
jgi:DNA-binding transcriptional ArsR family regulator